MFFGADIRERRRRLSCKALEMRQHRVSGQRWRSIRPFVSQTGVELRLDPDARRFSLGWMGDIFEADGSYMLNAAILTDQRVATQAIGGMLAGGAGVILGAVGAAPAPAPFRLLRSVSVRVLLDVPNFEELDFTVWENPRPLAARSSDVTRALSVAESFVRHCLSVS